MDELIKDKFEQMGARLRVREFHGAAIRVNVLRDRKGEYFDLTVDPATEVHVLDVRPKERHLVLMTRGAGSDRFLCGHDERAWFVAAVPNGASNVNAARDALKPEAVRQAMAEKRVRFAHRNRRKTRAFVRQGEWFFIPTDARVDTTIVLRNEPISRGPGSKPHVCEYLARTGGETVYVHRDGRVISEADYRKQLREGGKARGWFSRQRDAQVFVKGRVWHTDHKALHLSGWHAVVMNTESQAPSMRHVAFLD